MKRILVVEDDEGKRLLCHDEFSEVGYEVMPATNGRETLVMLDIVMPGMNGEIRSSGGI